MKIIYVLVLNILLLNIVVNSKAQYEKENHSFYYWFKAKVEIKIDRNSRKPEYKILHVSPTLECGSKNDFVAAYSHNLKNRIVTIGPFSEKEEAENSVKCYEYIKSFSGKEEEFLKSTDSTKRYWFCSNPMFLKRKLRMNYTRTAARVNFGSINDFNSILYESLSFKYLYVGPFTSHYNAEIAKFYQRSIGEDKANTSKRALKKMAKQVTKIKVKNTAPADTTKGFVTYKLDINIPPRYLHKKAMLVFQFQFLCLEDGIPSTNGITVQGEKVEDNNMVISWKYGGSFSFNPTFRIKEIENNNIELLSITPTFLNNTHIVKGESFVIDLQYNGK